MLWFEMKDALAEAKMWAAILTAKKNQRSAMEETAIAMLQEQLDRIEAYTRLAAKTVMTVDDASLFTGLSKPYIYKLACEKKIPHCKGAGGKLTYFKKSDLEQWMTAHRVMTNLEAEQAALNYCVSNGKGGAV